MNRNPTAAIVARQDPRSSFPGLPVPLAHDCNLASALDPEALDLLHERQADDALARGERVVAEYGHGWHRAGAGVACPPWPSTVRLDAAGHVVEW